MSRKFVSGMVFLTSLVIFSNFAAAVDAPTLHQVYQEAQAGKLDEAQKMMEKVLQAHPDSSKAHFVEAELLARQGRFGQADAELKTADRLDPGLPFAKAQSVESLKAKIANAQKQSPLGMKSAPEATPTGFPWGWLLLGIGSIGLIMLFVRNMRARDSANTNTGATSAPVQQAQAYNSGNGMGMPAPAAQPGWGNNPAQQPQPAWGNQPAPAASGMGSNLMKGLATGAAVGAGIVAGQALAHHFMDGNKNDSNPVSPVADSWNTPSDNMGGNDFGIADNGSWNDNANLADSGMDVGGDDWG